MRKQISPETKLLAAGSAAGLAGVDALYAIRGRISAIYLLDAFVEICLILLWFIVKTERELPSRWV